MEEEITPQAETPAAEVAQETTPEDVVPRTQYVGLQRKLSERDREIQELRARAVTRDDLELRDKRLFDALELVLPEDEEERPVSRRERLRQLREPPPQKAQPEPERFTDDEKVAAWRAMEIVDEMGWTESSPEVKKTARMTPDEALLSLRESKKAVLDKKFGERVEQARKAAIKESGGTGAAPSPSASGDDREVEPGSWGKAYSEAKTPADLLKRYRA